MMMMIMIMMMVVVVVVMVMMMMMMMTTEMCKSSFSNLLTLTTSMVLQIHSENGCQLY